MLRTFRVPRVRKSTEAQLRARKKYAIRHPEKVLAWRRGSESVEKLRQYNQQKRAKLRIEILSHYGPQRALRCSWVDCTVSDIDMLVLDHIADDGAAERKQLGGKNARGWNFYQLLKQLNFPDGYQTLCCNHNHKKELIRSRMRLPNGKQEELLT